VPGPLPLLKKNIFWVRSAYHACMVEAGNLERESGETEPGNTFQEPFSCANQTPHIHKAPIIPILGACRFNIPMAIPNLYSTFMLNPTHNPLYLPDHTANEHFASQSKVGARAPTAYETYVSIPWRCPAADPRSKVVLLCYPPSLS
jgi:hypothetical protein